MSRPSQGLKGTADDAVVTGPTRTVAQLISERPGSHLEIREVIDTMMAAIHRDNLNSPEHPYLGSEVALRFLASTHQVASLDKMGGPPAFERYLRQPHKQTLTTWREYRPNGRAIVIERSQHPWEAYQQLEVRSESSAEWSTVRWLLVKEAGAWRVDGVFCEEPDELDGSLFDELREVVVEAPVDVGTQRLLFDEFDEDGSGAIDEEEIWRIVRRLGIQVGGRAGLHALLEQIDLDGSGEIEFDEFSQLLRDSAAKGGIQADFAASLARVATTEGPREVVDLVMQGMRKPNEPYDHYGAARAVRYCSPTNLASTLSPEAFAGYLQEPWYRILLEWEEMELDDEEDVDSSGSTAEVEALVRRDSADSFSVVTFQLSRHNARWLIDSLTITE